VDKKIGVFLAIRPKAVKRMKKGIRKPSPAMIVACVALFMAGTGTGFAVNSVGPPSSVVAKQLKTNAAAPKKAAPKKKKVTKPTSKVVKRTAKGNYGLNYSRATANCKSKEAAIGGGADWVKSATDGWPVVSYSVPNLKKNVATGWTVEIDNISGSGGVQAIAWVFCAPR